MLDRNKSDLTHKVTQATYSWLDSHGFKPVETEVWMPPTSADEKAWIADLAAVIVPTQTELIEMKMILRRPAWKVDPEKREAWAAQYATLSRRMTCLVEVKTSRSDFIGDRKWKLTPPTDMAFVALAPGIIFPEEIPEAWGILVLRGEVMAKVRNPAVRQATIEEQLHVIYQIAIRRDHRTRYEAHRQWAQEDQSRRNEYVTAARVRDLVRVVRDLQAGKMRYTKDPVTSVQQVCEHHGLRHLKDAELEALAGVFGIAAKRGEPPVAQVRTFGRSLETPVPSPEISASTSE